MHRLLILDDIEDTHHQHIIEQHDQHVQFRISSRECLGKQAEWIEQHHISKSGGKHQVLEADADVKHRLVSLFSFAKDGESGAANSKVGLGVQGPAEESYFIAVCVQNSRHPGIGIFAGCD